MLDNCNFTVLSSITYLNNKKALKTKLIELKSLPTVVYFKSSCETFTWCAVMGYQSAAFLMHCSALSEWYFDFVQLAQSVSSRGRPRNQL